MMKVKGKYWIPVLGAIAILLATELTLRLSFGLGYPVLVQTDSQTGYRFQPNQKLVRFGKRVEYNQYSQRSEPISPKKTPGKLRILMVGDSVLNGGNPTDQAKTITALFEDKLAASRHPAEVLNASAGSWGIGNQLGYLRKFGTFNADAVILQIGSHDLTQPTSDSAVVGRHPAFPTHPPLLAVQDAWMRYAWPRFASQLGLNAAGGDFAASPLSLNPQQQFQQNMQSFKAIVSLVRAKKIPVFVLYTPNRYDVVPQPNIPRYKATFFKVLKTLRVPAVDAQGVWSKLPTATAETYFRDDVHLSVLGNQAIADLLFQHLCVQRHFPACLPKPKRPRSSIVKVAAQNKI